MHNDGDPAGQHRAVGATLMGMGSVFSVLAIYLMSASTALDYAFISPQGMLFFSLLFVVVGAWQWRSARHFQESEVQIREVQS